jgi:hypothetical protein
MGTYNACNPGVLDHSTILQKIADVKKVPISHVLESVQEQNKVT